VDTGNELDVLIIHSIYASEAVQSSPLDRVAMVIFISILLRHIHRTRTKESASISSGSKIKFAYLCMCWCF
jgi:hypothetical protein